MRSTSPAPLSLLQSHPYESYPSQSTWFLRATAISSSWLTLAAYTLFSLLVSPSDQLRWSTDVLASLGGIFLTSGYLGGLIAYYFARTLAFRLDSVVLPLLLASVGGLFAIILNWALHIEVQTGRAYVYAPLGVACVGTAVFSAAALYLNTQRKINMAVEESRRRHLELSGHHTVPRNSSWAGTGDAGTATAGTPFLDHSSISSSYHPSRQQQHSYHRYSHSLDTRQNTPRYPDSHGITTTHAPPRPYNLQTMPLPPPLRHMTSTEIRPIEMNIPEDEAQRRQLLRLLIAKEQSSPLSAAAGGATNDPESPDRGGIGTYRIDWPGSTLLDEHGDPLSSPPPPKSPGQTEMEEVKGQEVDEEEGRGRARSRSTRRSDGGSTTTTATGEISDRWSIGNLLGGKKKTAGGSGDGAGTKEGDGGGENREGGNERGNSRELLRLRQREERERRRREIERSGLAEGQP